MTKKGRQTLELLLAPSPTLLGMCRDRPDWKDCGLFVYSVAAGRPYQYRAGTCFDTDEQLEVCRLFG